MAAQSVSINEKATLDFYHLFDNIALQMGIESQLVVHFVPERMGEIERFAMFHASTYTFKDHEEYALQGAANHFRKAVTLSNVAATILPKIQEDQEQLDKYGATSGVRSREFTAVVEAQVTSLYSSLNCTVKVLRAVFPKAQGLPDSTRKLFQNGITGKIDSSLPARIRSALESATWFTELRVLRDALTHSNTGYCHKDRTTGKITYFHDSLRSLFHNGVISDFEAPLQQHYQNVNRFLGELFRAFNETLKDEESQAMCGVFGGRVYMRTIKPRELRDFHSGRCWSHTWFDQPEHPRCPFADKCGAYGNRSK